MGCLPRKSRAGSEKVPCSGRVIAPSGDEGARSAMTGALRSFGCGRVPREVFGSWGRQILPAVLAGDGRRIVAASVSLASGGTRRRPQARRLWLRYWPRPAAEPPLRSEVCDVTWVACSARTASAATIPSWE